MSWNRASFNHRNPFIARLLDLRWAISNFPHFSKLIFFNSNAGAITPFEILIALIIYAAVIAAVVVSSSTDSGAITTYLIFITVLSALRTSILQFLLGISWERGLLFHKFLGTVTLIAAGIHGIPLLPSKASDIMNDIKVLSGLIIFIMLGIQPILYTLVKPYYFEVFYFLHMAAYIVMIYFGIAHQADFVLYSVFIWGIDLLIRYILISRKITISAELIASDVIQLSFNKKIAYHPGQYVFLMIPVLGVMEWHPFSISSAPHEDVMTLHISQLGGWTSKLGKLTKEKKSSSQLSEITGFIEGPYGYPSINLEDETYQIVLLISGGIGVTPNHSITKNLLEASKNGRRLKKIFYIWTLRNAKNPALSLLHNFIESKQFYNITSPKSIEIGAGAEVSNRSNDEVISLKCDINDDKILFTEIYCTSGIRESTSDASAVKPISNDNSNVELYNDDIINGRPNFIQIFERIKQYTISQNETKVAVSICGPAPMIATATEACRYINSSSQVQFDLQIEIFNL